MTALKQDQLAFWIGFRDYARTHTRRITPTAPKADSQMPIAIGRTGFGLSAVASTVHWDGSQYSSGLGIRAEFQIFDARQIFDRLQKEQHRIQARFGEGRLIWFSDAGVKQCKVFRQERMDWRNPNKRQESYEWLVQNLDSLHRVFAPLARGPGIWDYAQLAWQKIKTWCRWTKDV